MSSLCMVAVTNSRAGLLRQMFCICCRWTNKSFFHFLSVLQLVTHTNSVLYHRREWRGGRSLWDYVFVTFCAHVFEGSTQAAGCLIDFMPLAILQQHMLWVLPRLENDIRHFRRGRFIRDGPKKNAASSQDLIRGLHIIKGLCRWLQTCHF